MKVKFGEMDVREGTGGGSGGLGYIPIPHLSDDLDVAKSKYRKISAEVPCGELSQAALSSSTFKLHERGVVLARGHIPGYTKDAVEKQAAFVLISLKQSLVLASQAGSFVNQVADLQEGRFYSGYVKEVRDFGALICVGSWRLAGVAHKFELANRFVEDAGSVVSAGQSVRALVKNVDTQKHRFEADLRPTAVTDKTLLEREAEALRLSLTERNLEEIFPKGKSGKTLLPGSMVHAEVTKIEAYGLVLSVKGITAVALKENMPMKELKGMTVGKSLRCTILDFNAETGILDVSLQPELLEKHGKPQKGMELSVLPALSKKSYVICWSPKPAAVLFAPPYTPSTWKVPLKTLLHSAESPMVIFCPCQPKET